MARTLLRQLLRALISVTVWLMPESWLLRTGPRQAAFADDAPTMRTAPASTAAPNAPRARGLRAIASLLFALTVVPARAPCRGTASMGSKRGDGVLRAGRKLVRGRAGSQRLPATPPLSRNLPLLAAPALPARCHQEPHGASMLHPPAPSASPPPALDPSLMVTEP